MLSLLRKIAGLDVKGLYPGISRDLQAIFYNLLINYDFGNGSNLLKRG